jgi:hypothetical protein
MHRDIIELPFIAELASDFFTTAFTSKKQVYLIIRSCESIMIWLSYLFEQWKWNKYIEIRLYIYKCPLGVVASCTCS